MRVVLQVLGAIALSCVCWFFAEAAWTAREVRPKLLVTIENVDRAAIAGGVAASHVEKATDVWNKASVAQTEGSTQLLAKGNASLDSFNAMIRRTDSNINEILIPSLNHAVTQQNDQLLATQKDAQADLQEFRASTVLLEQDLLTLNRTIGDPSIKQSFLNIERATENADATLGEAKASAAQLTAIVTDGRQVADKARETYLKPVNLWWGLVKTLLPLAGSAAQVVK